MNWKAQRCFLRTTGRAVFSGVWEAGPSWLTFGCPSRSSLWKTWQNFQQSTALLDKGSRLTTAQKVWAPFSWWVPKMQGGGNSQGMSNGLFITQTQQRNIFNIFIFNITLYPSKHKLNNITSFYFIFVSNCQIQSQRNVGGSGCSNTDNTKSIKYTTSLWRTRLFLTRQTNSLNRA